MAAADPMGEDHVPDHAPAPAVHSEIGRGLPGPMPGQRFMPSSELDRAALPRSTPDISSLAGQSWSGLPVRLRLFIDAQGTVVDVRVLRSNEDPELLDRLRRMLLATGFIPGRLNGADVASYKDIELNVGPITSGPDSR